MQTKLFPEEVLEKEPTADELLSEKDKNGRPLWVEPKMSFRFSIKFEGLDIPDYLFRRYKMYNDGEILIFEASLYETVDYTLSPVDFFKIFNVTVSFLDATGAVVSSWNFNIEGLSFDNSGDYGKEDLMTHNFKFEVNKKSFKIK